MEKPDYARLRELLEAQETFPTDFTHKFIGKNTKLFAKGVRDLQFAHPRLQLETARKSSGEKHLALTYVYRAESVDEIIEVLEAIHQIEDLHMIL
jgi:putative lipoic acid-binding regulatory protein